MSGGSGAVSGAVGGASCTRLLHNLLRSQAGGGSGSLPKISGGDISPTPSPVGSRRFRKKSVSMSGYIDVQHRIDSLAADAQRMEEAGLVLGADGSPSELTLAASEEGSNMADAGLENSLAGPPSNSGRLSAPLARLLLPAPIALSSNGPGSYELASPRAPEAHEMMSPHAEDRRTPSASLPTSPRFWPVRNRSGPVGVHHEAGPSGTPPGSLPTSDRLSFITGLSSAGDDSSTNAEQMMFRWVSVWTGGTKV